MNYNDLADAPELFIGKGNQLIAFEWLEQVAGLARPALARRQVHCH